MADGKRLTGDVDPVDGMPAAAVFRVSGQDNRAFQVSLPEPGSVSLTNGAASMKIENFTMKTKRRLTEGTTDVRVGGTLRLGANQEPGTYTGQFTVVVEYE